MSDEPEYLSGAQAAAALGVTKERVYELARAGRLGRQLAGYWVFTPAELAQYQQERAQRPKGGRPKARAGGTIPA